MTDFQQAASDVHMGALVLDLDRPDWYREVDTDKLDVGGFFSCVLGQLFGDYATGAHELFGAEWHSGAEEHGFFPRVDAWDGEAYRDAADRLTDLWRHEVFTRLSR
jgi:hypothetical protein